MLNHATEKVSSAKAKMLESEREHRRRAAVFKEAEQRVHLLEEKLKKEVKKTRAFFEMKDKFDERLEEIKKEYVLNLISLAPTSEL